MLDLQEVVWIGIRSSRIDRGSEWLYRLVESKNWVCVWVWGKSGGGERQRRERRRG